MSDSIPSSEYIQIVRELATLGTKIDNFFSAQNSMKTEIDGLKKDISAVKSDVTDPAGGIAWLAGQIAEPIMKKFLGV
jgi:hypothetical protein